MLTYIFAVIFLGVACSGAVLSKVYNMASATELKRQASGGNELAQTLYKAVGYGVSLRVLLWLWLVVGSAAGFALLAAQLPFIVSLLTISVLLWTNLIWIPRSRLTSLSIAYAKLLTPIVVWKLQYLDTPLRFIARLFGRIRPAHSGLYELQDLLNMLDLQSNQHDNRITSEEITLIRNVVSFGDRTVQSVMRPRKSVRSVVMSDAIGPVLLDELHASGQTIFPVKKAARSKEIVAALHLHDIGIHSSGTVERYATQGVTFVHEQDSLADALHQFFKTRQQLFVVIDAEQDYLGVITLEDILDSLIPRPAPVEVEDLPASE